LLHEIFTPAIHVLPGKTTTDVALMRGGSNCSKLTTRMMIPFDDAMYLRPCTLEEDKKASPGFAPMTSKSKWLQLRGKISVFVGSEGHLETQHISL